MLRYHDYFLAHIRWRLKIGEERGPGELVRDPGKGDGKATLHLAWKICKVLIAFYNYLGAGRLSYPIHSLVPPSLTTLFSAFSHPPRSYRGVSSFSFSLSHSLSDFLSLSSTVVPWFPRFCPFATLSLSLPRTLTRVRRFLSHRTASDTRVCPIPAWRPRSHVFTLGRARR